jgi:signal peptide peptidase SppA
MGANGAIGRIIILADSPGGLSLGVPESAEVVRRVAKRKPVDVIAQNFLASAAYWVCCSATSITATPSAYVGSIGVMTVVLDESALFQAAGLKVIAIASSELKAAGTPGLPTTNEFIASLQRLVDYSMARFQADVERGRKLDRKQLDAASTGEVWHAGRAVALGLVDRVMLFEDALAQFTQPQKPRASVLAGQAAADRLQELVLARAGKGADWQRAETEIRREQPQLAAAVDDFERATS